MQGVMAFWLIVLVLSSLLLEGSFFPPVFGNMVIPDLILVSVICSAFIRGERKGAFLGLCGGLLQDILFSSSVGYFALVKTLIGYAAGLCGRVIYRDQLVAPIFLTFVATFIHEGLLSLLTRQYMGAGLNLDWALRLIFIPKAFIHLALALLIYPLFYRLEQKKSFSLRQREF